ncbi:MAG TPA: autotransporter-associated beta strand repeat-containing protein, partial [Myxococcota bacterium]|nr:autotransporter-associated beta strand repeat-containing protein [Myxococcota bacterium]
DGGYQFSGKKLVVLASILVVDPIAGTPVTMAWPMVMHGGGISVDPDGAPGDELIISGAIEGVGRLVKENTGTLRLSGANTFRGGIDIAEGTLTAAGGSALPDFGDVACLGAGTLHVDAAGDSVPSLRGACAVILDGPLVLTDVDDDSYSGAMSGPGVLTKRGGGFLALTGDGGTHSGALLIQEGSVFINSDYGATAVTVSSSATLAGNGNPGAITVASGGTVAPGGAGPAILTSSSNVALAAGSTLAVKLNGTVSGTGYDRLAANGDIALGGSTLAVDMGFTASEGNAFTIVQCTGALTGTFAGIADQGAVIFESQRFIVDYTANAVILTRDDP